MEVTLDDVMIGWVKVFQRASEEYATSLAPRFRLDDEGACLTLLELGLKIAVFGWEEPSAWEELKLLRKLALHLGEVPAEVVLSGELVHSREMVNLLMSFLNYYFNFYVASYSIARVGQHYLSTSRPNCSLQSRTAKSTSSPSYQ